MSKADYILRDNQYILEIRAEVDPSKVDKVGRQTFTRQISIATHHVRAEGMVTAGLANIILTDLVALHQEICDVADDYKKKESDA